MGREGALLPLQDSGLGGLPASPSAKVSWQAKATTQSGMDGLRSILRHPSLKALLGRGFAKRSRFTEGDVKGEGGSTVPAKERSCARQHVEKALAVLFDPVGAKAIDRSERLD
jgi:hypothetical protein